MNRLPYHNFKSTGSSGVDPALLDAKADKTALDALVTAVGTKMDKTASTALTDALEASKATKTQLAAVQTDLQAKLDALPQGVTVKTVLPLGNVWPKTITFSDASTQELALPDGGGAAVLRRIDEMENIAQLGDFDNGDFQSLVNGDNAYSSIYADDGSDNAILLGTMNMAWLDIRVINNGSELIEVSNEFNNSMDGKMVWQRDIQKMWVWNNNKFNTAFVLPQSGEDRPLVHIDVDGKPIATGHDLTKAKKLTLTFADANGKPWGDQTFDMTTVRNHGSLFVWNYDNAYVDVQITDAANGIITPFDAIRPAWYVASYVTN